MVWDCLLLDTGDICVNFEVIPTNGSYLAESTLVTGNGTLKFTPLSEKRISFKAQDKTGSKFIYRDHAPVLLDPYNRRYLITDKTDELYTVSENTLLKLDETELNAELFEKYGVQDIPAGTLLLSLKNPTILYWHDSENSFPRLRQLIKDCLLHRYYTLKILICLIQVFLALRR